MDYLVSDVPGKVLKLTEAIHDSSHDLPYRAVHFLRLRVINISKRWGFNYCIDEDPVI